MVSHFDSYREEPSTTGEGESWALPVAHQASHLLKVAGAEARDGQRVWNELWSEFRTQVASGGAATQDATRSFIPKCGWVEFLERFWLLKHHIDSIVRVSQCQSPPK